MVVNYLKSENILIANLTFMDSLTREVDSIKKTLEKLQGYPRLERTYQKHLEEVIGASHIKCKFGVSDIETDTDIIEIKHFSQYKAALGQLLFYNYRKNKRLKVYLFGNVPKNITEICDVFEEFNVEVYHIWKDCDNITVERMDTKQIQDEFTEWCTKNIIFKHDNILTLSDVCKAFHGCELSPREASRTKLKIQDFIRKTFPSLNNNYQHTTYNGVNYRGWLHLMISNTFIVVK